MGKLVMCNGRQYEIGKFYMAGISVVELVAFDADRTGYFKFMCRGSEGNLWASSLSEVDGSVLGKVTIPERVLEVGKLYEFSDYEDFSDSVFEVLDGLALEDEDGMCYSCDGFGWYQYCRPIQGELGK